MMPCKSGRGVKLIDEIGEAVFDAARELALQGVAQLVELAVLGPAAAGGIARFVGT